MIIIRSIFKEKMKGYNNKHSTSNAINMRNTLSFIDFNA